MKYFKNKKVAIAVMAAAILLSFVIGITNKPKVDVPTGGEKLDESISTAIFAEYLVDEAGVLSDKTEEQVKLYNANWDRMAGSIMAVVTVESTYGEAEAMAWEWAEELQLGQDDAILLINTADGTYSVVASGSSYDRIAAQGASFVDTALYEYVQEQEYNEAVLSLFRGMHLIYGGEPEVQEVPEEKGGVGVLGVIILLVVLVVVFSVVDDILFSRWHARYGTMLTPTVAYRPILWWHRPGTKWYKQRRSAVGKKPGGSGGMRPPMGGASSGGSKKTTGGTVRSGSFGGGRGGTFGSGTRPGSTGRSGSGKIGGNSRSGSFGGGSRGGGFGSFGGGSFGGGSRPGSFGGGSFGGSRGGGFGSRGGSFGGGRGGGFGGKR